MPHKPKPGKGGRSKRTREEEEEPELFTPDNQPPKKKPATEDPNVQPGHSAEPEVEEHEEPENEDVCPGDKTVYTPEPKNWQGMIPEDSCK